VLDDMMERVFSNPASVIIGFGFSSDISMFAQKLPHMKFIKYIHNFIDAQTYFGQVCGAEAQTGLNKVALRMLGKQVCKAEQMSNWEGRPLRQSQQHYGALDAYVLIDIIKALIEQAKNDELEPISEYIETLDRRNVVVNEDYDSDEYDDERI